MRIVPMLRKVAVQTSPATSVAASTDTETMNAPFDAADVSPALKRSEIACLRPSVKRSFCVT